MTLLPHDRQDVQGVSLPAYSTDNVCFNPVCGRLATEKHHLWRRSFLTGDFNGVKLWDGTELRNLVGLCHVCHQKITENKAKIALLDRPWHFLWQEEETFTDSLEDVVPKHVERSLCPTCERPLPQTRQTTEVTRVRRTWAITVPKDNQEDGADVLDTLLNEVRLELARRGIIYGDEKKTRYFILSTALALFVQHVEEIMSDD